MNLNFSKQDIAISAVVLAAVSLLFLRTVRFEFVNIDDPYYVLGHEVVEQGLTGVGVRYAFTSVSEGNYLPLTWLSHMLAVEAGGTGPAAHHVANVLLHGLTAALLFLFLKSATGSIGRSFLVALLWGVHPLRVESVAWVAERKDVLSGLFFVLALMAYVGYARRQRIERYMAVVLVLALGLLAKSILMIVPCVFLLLDLWPLARVRIAEPGVSRRISLLVAEKIPLFLLSAAAGVLAIWSQRSAGALGSIEFVSLSHRGWNALASLATYLFQTIWPLGLGVYYPYRDNQTLYLWGTAGLCIGIVATAIAVYQHKSRPYLMVGWLWFLVTLAPVIGLVQVGLQAHADRYTYLPHMGVFLALVWMLADVFERRMRYAPWRVPAVAGLVLVCALLTWRQLGFWRDSETLFAHTLAVTGPNRFAEGNYGDALMDQGRYGEAERHFRRAIEIGPPVYLDPHNLGASLVILDRPQEARDLFEEALRLKPEYRPSWVLLGDASLTLQEPQRAIEAYREAHRLGENSPRFHTNFGIAFAMAGRFAEAEAEFNAALGKAPSYAPALFNLGLLEMERRSTAKARELFEQVLALVPDDQGARAALDALDSQ